MKLKKETDFVLIRTFWKFLVQVFYTLVQHFYNVCWILVLLTMIFTVILAKNKGYCWQPLALMSPHSSLRSSKAHAFPYLVSAIQVYHAMRLIIFSLVRNSNCAFENYESRFIGVPSSQATFTTRGWNA